MYGHGAESFPKVWALKKEQAYIARGAVKLASFVEENIKEEQMHISNLIQAKTMVADILTSNFALARIYEEELSVAMKKVTANLKDWLVQMKR